MMAIAGGMVPPSQRNDEDVMELCEHYELEDRIMKQLNEKLWWENHEMRRSPPDLWLQLRLRKPTLMVNVRGSNSPPGVLMTRIKQMQEAKMAITEAKQVALLER